MTLDMHLEGIAEETRLYLNCHKYELVACTEETKQYLKSSFQGLHFLSFRSNSLDALEAR